MDTPAETKSDGTQGDSGRRSRRVAGATLVGLASRFISAIIGFATVPIALKHLENERYGVWLTLTSVIAGMAFADLGIGNGLLNAVAAADAKGDREEARRAVSSAFFALLGIAAFFSVGFLIVSANVDWAQFFNVKSPGASTEVSSALTVLFFATVAQIPLGVAQRVQFGFQEGALAGIWTIATAVASFIGIFVAVKLNANLPWLLAGATFTSVAVALACFISEFFIRRPWLRPRFADFTPGIARALLNVGILFIALQVANWISLWSDNLVVARVLGASAVSSYGNCFKLFSAAMIYQYIGPSLWPAFADALARKDLAWVRRTFYKGLYANAAISGFLAICFLWITGPIVLRWAGESQVPTHETTVAFCVWFFVYSFIGVFASLCNTGANIKTHTILFSVASVTSIPFRFLGAHALGQAGVLYATAGSYGFLYILPMLFVVGKMLSKGAVSPEVAQ